MWTICLAVLTISSLAGAAVLTRAPTKIATAAKAETADRRVVRIWQPPKGLVQQPIWPRGAPEMAMAGKTPESVLIARTPNALHGTTSEAAFDVTDPTMTVFPARGRSSGAAIVLFPGGGFKAVVLTSEGTEICDWITARGVTCVLSKYRVPLSGHHFDKSCNCGVEPRIPRALQDAQRTIRLVRSRAAALKIDPARIGVMGFSAGGYLAVQTSTIFPPAYTPVDAIDWISSRPDFAIAFFPGHLCRPGGKLDPAIHVTARTPPTFLVQAWDDPVNERCNSTLYARALDEAGVPAEVHMFAKGGHAFTLRRTTDPVAAWPGLLDTWLKGIGVSAR